MKFQSLEESSGVSILQEYVIGLNSLVEKSFIIIRVSLWVQFSFWLVYYRPSNLLKIGVIIYSTTTMLKRKYYPGCVYECFPPAWSAFNDIPWFLLLHAGDLAWETGTNTWETASVRGGPEVGVTCSCHFCLSSACYWTSSPTRRCG